MLEIRLMKNEDINRVLEIENTSFIAKWQKKDFLYELNENPFSTIIVLVIDDVIQGFLDFMITFSSASISQIAISEQSRNKGYGKKLLEEMMIILKNKQRIDIVTLEVREHNISARKFYEKNGFRFICIKPNYYSNGDSAIYMCKEVNYGNNISD